MTLCVCIVINIGMNIVTQRTECGGKIDRENKVSFHFLVSALISTETSDISNTFYYLQILKVNQDLIENIHMLTYVHLDILGGLELNQIIDLHANLVLRLMLAALHGVSQRHGHYEILFASVPMLIL